MCGTSRETVVSAGIEQPDGLRDRLALSVEEAAAALGVSERHLRAILTEIPHTYLGRRVVIPVEGLRTWLQERSGGEVRRVDRVAEEELRALVGGE